MKNYQVRRYEPNDFSLWNDFVHQAKNATFLFHRDFMEYHSDRFDDYSLMVFNESALVAILPANKKDDVVHSHQGLTYGGFVFRENIKATSVHQIFLAVINFLKMNTVKEFYIKPILPFYAKQNFLEIDCFIIQNKGKLYRKDLNLVVDLTRELCISKSKLKHFRKPITQQLEMKKEKSFHLFWEEVLIPRLSEKHQVNPVHTHEEMAYLEKKFPQNIFQYNAYFEGQIVAGITIFEFDGVIKSQYGATTALGEKLRALDFLFINLIQQSVGKFQYFDMGTVTENHGSSFNEGLLNQKQELGCMVYAQDFYKIMLHD